MGRLTIQEDAGNANWWGDRTLVVWAGPGYFHFTTYDFCFNGCDNWNVIQNIDYGNELTNWFFIYYSYSYEQ